MKNKLIFGICMLFILILITSCMPEVETEVVRKEVKEESLPTKPVTLPDSAIDEGITVEEEKPVEEFEEKDEIDQQTDDSLDFMTGAAVAGLSEIDPRVSELLEKAKKNKEMRYYYSESPDVHVTSQFFIKDDQMKAIQPEPPAYIRGKYYNTVYLDTKTKETSAYCEDEKRCDDMNREFEADYDVYYRLTTRDWALFVDESAEVLGTEVMFNRDVTLVQFEKAGITYRVWLYNYHGLAAKVVENYGSPKANIMFFEMISTHVSDTEIEHQYVDS